MNPARTADIPVANVRAAVLKHLGQRAAAHCVRTGEMARDLAARYDLDADAAETAGLLHDWSRQDADEQLLTYAEDAGLTVLPEERLHPYLLHARVGAEQVRQAFPGMSAEILSAIAAHTVGSVPMSPLDKVVYIADAIELGRDYSGVDDLRALADRVSLDELFGAVYARSVACVAEKGAPLHPITALVGRQIERETGVSPFPAVDR